MPISSSLRPAVLEARHELHEQREKLRVQHDEGSPGLQVAAKVTAVFDSIVIGLFDAALAGSNLGDKVGDIALIAHGGYGRRDIAPFSDVDLMLTPMPSAEKAVGPLAKRLSQDIVDAGLQLGFSVRTPRQACLAAWQDATVFTSLVESRLLVGSSAVYTSLMSQLRAGARRRQRALCDAVNVARLNERAKWGEAGYLLRPNVKRGRGALRDIQLVRWIGFACFGESDPDQLMRLGAMSEQDLRTLRKALTFLLRLRNEMHFRAGKANDVLDRPTQMAIAERWQYPGEAGVLPVEKFMSDYFSMTSEVRYASANFLDSVQTRSRLGSAAERIMAKTVGSGLRMGPWHLWIPADRLQEVATNIDAVLELVQLARKHRRRIDHDTWNAIREAMRSKAIGELAPHTAARFMAMLSEPIGLGDVLNSLHELRVLEHLVPALVHARCLLQFNEYHKYTVDAHSIRAVQAATEFRDADGIIGELYRKLKDPALLHLTLLLHDLGKGFEEDHSELGRRIARETGTRLRLSESDISLMELLIFKHLRLADVAHRHDLNSRQIIEDFGREIGSVKTLQWLLLHTVADLTAVGPDVLTDWKRRLMEELYTKTFAFLQTGTLPGDADPVITEIRNAVTRQLPDTTPELVRQCLQELPEALLRDRSPEAVVADLARIAPLAYNETSAVVWGTYDETSDAVSYTVVIRQEGEPIGTFARATGALSSRGLEILRAEIHTIADSIAWDSFTVHDPDTQGEPTQERLDQISAAIADSLKTEDFLRPKFLRRWQLQSDRTASVAVLPTRVEFDNSTAPQYTVLSVFAYDRPGLLYDIARTLAQAGIVLHFAKIATHFDQAADIFYVTELDDSKLESSERQADVRSRLLDMIARPR